MKIEMIYCLYVYSHYCLYDIQAQIGYYYMLTAIRISLTFYDSLAVTALYLLISL